MLFMVRTTWGALAAASVFVAAGLVALALHERDAAMLLFGMAGGTGVVGRKGD